jgi:hypothetical protein
VVKRTRRRGDAGTRGRKSVGVSGYRGGEEDPASPRGLRRASCGAWPQRGSEGARSWQHYLDRDRNRNRNPTRRRGRWPRRGSPKVPDAGAHGHRLQSSRPVPRTCSRGRRPRRSGPRRHSAGRGNVLVFGFRSFGIAWSLVLGIWNFTARMLSVLSVVNFFPLSLRFLRLTDLQASNDSILAMTSAVTSAFAFSTN